MVLPSSLSFVRLRDKSLSESLKAHFGLLSLTHSCQTQSLGSEDGRVSNISLLLPDRADRTECIHPRVTPTTLEAAQLRKARGVTTHRISGDAAMAAQQEAFSGPSTVPRHQ